MLREGQRSWGKVLHWANARGEHAKGRERREQLKMVLGSAAPRTAGCGAVPGAGVSFGFWCLEMPALCCGVGASTQPFQCFLRSPRTLSVTSLQLEAPGFPKGSPLWDLPRAQSWVVAMLSLSG